MRARAFACLALCWTATCAQPALAGGLEFPGGGTRSLGRGAAALARADDPSTMLRNPAALAELWDDQLLLGAHLALARSCFRGTGVYGWDVFEPDIADFGEGPRFLQAEEGDRDLDGVPLQGYLDQPLPEQCDDGPAPFLPQLALSMKPTPDLGLGLGFFAPDRVSLSSFGRRDGTTDTPAGRLPDPLRFGRTQHTVTYFSLLGAAGYRVSPALQIGLGLRWTLLVLEATQFAVVGQTRNPRTDVRVDVFGRDLFIPSVTASLQLKPIPALDVALSAQWSDRIRSSAKLDLTANAFGIGAPYRYLDAQSGPTAVAGTIPTTSPNERIELDIPALWMPQIALAIRFADRLKPLPRDRARARDAAGAYVEDAMGTERWDVELDVVYYFSSAYDEIRFTTYDAEVELRSVAPNGTVTSLPFAVGRCIEPDMTPGTAEPCPKQERAGRTRQGGRNQWSLRAGGDYNLLAGVLALRAGVSYETDGRDVELHVPFEYLLSRWGLHAGLTLRVAHKTDVSFGYAHFIQRDVRLQVNPESRYPRKYKTPEYNFRPGAGEPDALGAGADADGGFDGVARADLSNGDDVPGPHYLNAGSFQSALDVLSVSFAQHF